MRKAAVPQAWAPVPVAVQIARHNAALAAAKKKAAAPVAVQQAKHKAALKAAASRKAKKTPRKWSPDEDVAMCSLRAVAAAGSLALTDAELLDVYWSAAADADSGMPILAAVAALGWPRLHMPVLGVTRPQPHAVAVDPSGLWWSWGALWEPWAAEPDEVWVPGWPR